MKYISFNPNGDYSVAILIKENGLNEFEIRQAYFQYLPTHIPETTFLALSLQYDSRGRTTAEMRKAYLEELLPVLREQRIQALYIADADYYKTVMGLIKVSGSLGYVRKSVFPGYENFDVIYGVNHKAVLYSPTNAPKLEFSMQTLVNHLSKTYVAPGNGVADKLINLYSILEIEAFLESALKYPYLSCDIEAFSLKFWEAGIGTITFSWSLQEGVSFPVDLSAIGAKRIREKLVWFFENYQGKLRYHNGSYDVKVLVYELFMEQFQDYVGMLHGIEVLTRNFDDTKLIAYLATNNTDQNTLGLKELSHTFAGKYANIDIKNIAEVPLGDLLTYNGVDGLCTNYVYETYYPIMVADGQLELYEEIFKPAMQVLLQTELCGMPVDLDKVQEAKTELTVISQQHLSAINKTPEITDFTHKLRLAQIEKDNETLKTKKRQYEEVLHIVFNPNSDQQLQKLFYDTEDGWGYEILARTESGAPATGKKVINKLISKGVKPAHEKIMKQIIEFCAAQKILTTFIKALEGAVRMPDGSYRLFGNFNLGGTQSARLSSSDPNLQNLPSGSKYGKMIKQCFCSIMKDDLPEWLYAGADFEALEAKIGAILPNDPNKIKIYRDGYDSHSYHAYAYFGDGMPDINPIDEATAPPEQEYFEITIGKTTHIFKTGDSILVDGHPMAIEDYHEMATWRN